jgi:hypothetical protein
MCADAAWLRRVAAKSIRAVTATMKLRPMKWTGTPSKKLFVISAIIGSQCLKRAQMKVVAPSSPPIFAPCATFLMTELREIIITAINAEFVG